MNEKQKRILMALIGVLVTGCSVGLFQMASLGTDPFTSFVTGICNLFNMKFGVFDFVVKDNEYYFLEINANGQWAWLEKELNIDISSSLFNYLSEGI